MSCGLGGARFAERVPDGRIVVVEPLAHEIRVFDREGRHLASFGGRGGGPEEFGGPPWIELVGSDTLLVWDPGHYRLSRYSLSGELFEQVGTDLVEAARGQLPEMARGLGVPLRRLEGTFDEIPLADSLPAIGALERGDDGRLWVGRRLGVSWTREPVGTFDVFAPTGRWVGSVDLPPDVFRLLRAGQSHVVVAAIDELDVQ